MSTWIALFILAMGGILLVSDQNGIVANIDSTEFGYLVAGLAVLVFVSGGLFSRYGGRAGAMLRDLVSWTALGLALVTLYAYRDDLEPVADRVIAELVPGRGMIVEEKDGHAEVKLHRRLGGHFTAEVKVNGKLISMIIDTGATTVVLRDNDARAVGIDTDKLKYNIPVLTANGTAMAARVRLDQVGIGPLTRGRVDALVTKKGALVESLLGMSFLSRLRSYEFSGDYLTLRG